MADVIHRETMEVRRSVNLAEYSLTDWLILKLKQIDREPKDTPLKFCEIIGEDIVEVSPADRQIIEAEELAAAKADKIEELTSQFVDTFDAHYSPSVQSDLLSMLDESRRANDAEMAEHIHKVQQWKNAGKPLLWAAHDEVAAAENAEQIAAVKMDLADWENTDPKISIRELGGE